MNHIFSILTLMGMPFLALAQIGGVTPATIPPTINILNIIDSTVNFLLGFLLAVIVLFIFYMMFLSITGSDQRTFQNVSSAIGYALMALIIAIASKGLVFLFRQIIGT